MTTRRSKSGRVLLLSIRPRYADAILRGDKTVELRRRSPRLHDGDLVLIYASTPRRALVGAFTAGGVAECSPDELWRAFHSEAGVSREAFADYFAGKELGAAIEVTGVWTAPRAVELDELRRLWPGFVPPQSYRYVDSEALECLPPAWRRPAEGAR